ncbi:MAG TPA: PP2C family protein-serine/threonine phosphatase [Phycisphaerales bacterium]|nr:PP2C family protein-serine/threonine phosphatase [Phycisphaerales bacterium]
MGQHNILVATCESRSEGDGALLSNLLAAWPDETAPTTQRMTFDQLLARLIAGDESLRTRAAASLLLVTNRQTVEAIDRCVDELRTANLPAVILADDAARWKPLQQQGVIVQPTDTPAGVLAAMLYALAERQELVDQMSRELSITMRVQAGARAEVERMHEELHLAAGVQHEFTAGSLPVVEQLEMGVVYRPVNAVSGDIYHVRQMPDGRVAFFIADAVGHGVPAALLTMVLTNSLLSADRDEGEISPSHVLERLNRRLLDSSLHTGRFATAVYGIVDPVSGEAHIAGAGHPAPIVMSPRGAHEVLTDGPLLGVFSDAEFPTTRVKLCPGETLVLYTDGLEAAFPVEKELRATRLEQGKHAFAHVDHLESLFKRLAAHDPSAVLTQLEYMLDEQCGSLHQADDITTLAIRMRCQTDQRREIKLLAA